MSENLTLFEPAPFGPRLGAHLIDFILTNGVEFGVEYGVLGIIYCLRKFVLHHAIDFGHTVEPVLEQVVSGLFGLWLAYYYYVVFQLKKETTLGKKVFSIIVVDYQTGQPMTRKQALIRLVAYLPSYLLIGCGFFMAAFHPEKRALHDIIAGTICIKKPKMTAA